MLAKLIKSMRIAKNLFSPKSSRVVRVLLINFPKTWTIEALSKEAGISIGYTHAIVSRLLQEKHAIKNQRGRLEVLDPVRLLRRWAAYNSYSTSNTFVHFYTFEQDIEKFLEKFKKRKGPTYSLAVLAGSLFYAPYVRATSIHCYVKNKEDAKKWAKLLGLKPTEGGGNIVFAIPKDDGVFYGSVKIKGIEVVSDVQLYVDLFNYPARGEEAAEALLKVIEKKWAQKRKERMKRVL